MAPVLRNVTSLFSKLISAFRSRWVNKSDGFFSLYADSISLLAILSKAANIPPGLTKYHCTVLDICSARSSLCSLSICTWITSETSELTSITSFGSPSNVNTFGSGCSNFTSRARDIRFSSRMHLLGKRLIISCLMTRGLPQAFSTLSFKAVIIASNDSDRAWMTIFWGRLLVNKSIDASEPIS